MNLIPLDKNNLNKINKITETRETELDMPMMSYALANSMVASQRLTRAEVINEHSRVKNKGKNKHKSKKSHKRQVVTIEMESIFEPRPSVVTEVIDVSEPKKEESLGMNQIKLYLKELCCD
jgi:hypothetical protein